jgi:hypothetical protein
MLGRKATVPLKAGGCVAKEGKKKNPKFALGFFNEQAIYTA